ncbi:carboxyltransferase domain-containing protein [Corynebacteriaceae bacterium 7-707]
MNAPAAPVIHRVGTRALLVDLPDLPTAMAWHRRLTDAPLDGQRDVVAAARTVLVVLDSPSAVRGALDRLGATGTDLAGDSPATDPRTVTVDVVYDGPDLGTVAEQLGMSADGVVRHHTSATWTGAFGGFAPGFTYCVGRGVPSVARRDTPRTAVPAGAVGLAGEFSAVYPRSSPGGWQLIGTSATPVWDPSSEEPAMVRPGDRVVYRAVRHRVEICPTAPGPAARERADAPLTLTDAGLLTLVEDAGRPGHGALGVTPSGAADRASAQVANDVVGNAAGEAVLENIGGLSLTAARDVVVAVTGADAPVTVDGRPVGLARPLLLTAGAAVTVGAARSGLRSYVAVRGGVRCAGEVLGSLSTDVLSGLGPPPLRPGTPVATGDGQFGPTRAGTNPVRVPEVLRVVAGPRDDWFTGGVSALTGREWTVSPASDRVGVRLSGPPVSRRDDRELPSEGMVAGCVQVAPDGQPVLFLRDHAVTGGYPVIATVIAEDLDAAAQLAPGATVRFEEYQ